MKKVSFIVLAGLLLGAAASLHAQKVELKTLWESDSTLRTPESVLYEPTKKVLYVACINGQPSPDNKKSYIAKVGLDGKVQQLKFTDNLNSTKGMRILGNKLYVTEMTQIAEIDLATGKVLKRYPVTGAKFLNDITVDTKKNTVYISDSNDSKIWALSNGKLSLVLEGSPLKGTNGLLFENEQLLIGNGDGSLLSMNPSTKKLTTIGKVSGGIDGIVALGNKQYIVTEWGGKVWHVGAGGKTELKIDSSKEKINTADVGYNPSTKQLFVPTFFHNTVKAYAVQ